MASTLPPPIRLITRQTGGYRIHTFISAYTGNNIADATHIIEGPTSLVLIDGQFLKDYARQFREYADEVTEQTGKPIDRLYLTHRHPDHWFGLGTAFKDVRIYALPETIDFLKEHGQEQICDHNSKLGEQAPSEVVIPQYSVIIPPNDPQILEQSIDGLRYVFTMVKETEIDFHMIIGLPDLQVCIVQDLIYSGNHLYLTAPEDMANWVRFLETMLLSDYDLFLAGHGQPADKIEVARNVEYLLAAQVAIADGLRGDYFKQYMLRRYPERLCPAIFDIYLPRLFDGASSY
ncbi:beta-lactamase domain-containing protein [Novosphingobium sp. Rr 2-17]|uniref:MBL fold metallo-hydrolase n=1 Tax=Novosphingobium sp. Rr 2-17 TaxID=555793 RepID=UPI000269A86F|nr:MBL fold metallo-hydrolase [Novosphingobium sp. Rr 2-17]EIZ77907.1 beta-lactamase domain-containing protein [Novosphingobium sp. Rr 2-17]